MIFVKRPFSVFCILYRSLPFCMFDTCVSTSFHVTSYCLTSIHFPLLLHCGRCFQCFCIAQRASVSFCCPHSYQIITIVYLFPSLSMIMITIFYFAPPHFVSIHTSTFSRFLNSPHSRNWQLQCGTVKQNAILRSFVGFETVNHNKSWLLFQVLLLANMHSTHKPKTAKQAMNTLAIIN